jgi:hypothetical protein
MLELLRLGHQAQQELHADARGRGGDVGHGAQPDVVARHQLARLQRSQPEAVLVRLHLQAGWVGDAVW